MQEMRGSFDPCMGMRLTASTPVKSEAVVSAEADKGAVVAKASAPEASVRFVFVPNTCAAQAVSVAQ